MHNFMHRNRFKNEIFETEIPKPTSMIAEYYGIEIEVVMIVEAYL